MTAVPRKGQKEEVSVRRSHLEGSGTGPMTGGRCRGGGGGYGPHSHEVWGDGVECERHRNKKCGGHQDRERRKRVTRTKKRKKKDPTVGKKKPEKIRTMSSERIDLVAFPEGLTAHPLDQRKFLIRSTWRNTVRQSSYIPSVLKIVLDVLGKIYVVQIVLLYYPRSTNPRCANT